MGGAGVFGIFTFIPLYATSVHKLSTLVSGMILDTSLHWSHFRLNDNEFFSSSDGVTGGRWWWYGPDLLSTLLLAGQGFQLIEMMGFHLGVAEILAILIMITGIGNGIALPASNNACIELMPEKVATITGLRGMFRSVGERLEFQ